MHYNLTALAKRLEESPVLFGETVGRQQFLARVPHYRENIEVGLQLATPSTATRLINPFFLKEK